MIEEHIAVRDERAEITTQLRPAPTQGERACEQPCQVPQPRHDTAGRLGVVPGDVVPNSPQVSAGFRRNDEPGHLLALRLVQELGEHALAIKALATLELVEANSDGTPQGG